MLNKALLVAVLVVTLLPAQEIRSLGGGGSGQGFVYTGILATIPATCTVGQIAFITNASAGQNIYECAATNVWTQQLNSGAGGASTALDNLASVAVNTALVPASAGTIDLGTTAKPFRNLIFGASATNNTKLASAVTTAQRTVTTPDADSVTGIPKVAATHKFFSALTAGGVLTDTQPACADISDAGNVCTVTLGAGVGTFLTTPTSANLASAVTNETGSGLLVFGTGPVIDLTNATGLPAAAVLAGTFGTGNYTVTGNFTATGSITSGSGSGAGGALDVAQGTLPSIVANTVSIVAPTSVTGYEIVMPGAAATGIFHLANSANVVTATISAVSLTADVSGTLPVGNGGTGITSLGSGVATFLGTPSSANLISALTDETGTGAAVFATSPTLVTPLLGTPTSGVLTNATGYLWSALASPPFVTNAQTATYQVLAGDFTQCKTIPVASGTFTITLVASGSQPATGQCLFILNYGTGVVTLARSGQNINGAASNLTGTAGSATAPTGWYVVSDGTNYIAEVIGGGGSGANAALSNLASVSINSVLGFQTGIAVGNTTNPASNIVFNASGTYGTGSFTFAGTPTGNRALTIPDASDTFAMLGQAQTFTGVDTFKSAGTTPSVANSPLVIKDSAGTALLYVGPYQAGYPAIWAGTLTPSTVNFGIRFVFDGTYTVVNAITEVQVANAGTAKLFVNASGVTVGTSIPFIAQSSVTFSGLGTASGTPDSMCLNTNTVERNAALTCTVSNESVKNSIVSVPGTVEDFMRLRPIQFEYNDVPGRTRWGFGAMQVASVNPALADGWRPDGLPWSLDQNAILALTVKTVQELKAEIAVLKAR